MDRRRIIMSGKQFLIDFIVSEGAENCWIELDGRKISAGGYKISKGKEMNFVINIPIKSIGGRIIYNGEIVASANQITKSQKINYKTKIANDMYITAENINGLLIMQINEK